MMRYLTYICLCLLIATTTVHATETSKEDAVTINEGIRIEHAWAPPSLKGARIGVAYASIHYDTKKGKDILRAASSPVAQAAEIHAHIMDENVMRMEKLEQVEITKNEPLVMKQGGYHLMLIDLKQPLNEGEKFPLTLTFEHAGPIEIDVQVKRKQ